MRAGPIHARSRRARWRSHEVLRAPSCSRSRSRARRGRPTAAARRTGAQPAGPDAVMSDNVEYLGSIKQDVGPDDGREGDRRPDVRHLGQEHLDLRHLRPREAEAAGRDEGQRRLGERGGPDQRQGAGGRERLLLGRRPRVRGGGRGHGLRPALRRARPGEHQAGRRDPGRQPHGRVRARLPVLLRPRGHDHRRARRPRRPAADGRRQLDRRADEAGRRVERAATTSARSGPACC